MYDAIAVVGLILFMLWVSKPVDANWVYDYDYPCGDDCFD